MKKIIRLTESELNKMIKRVLSEARVSDCVQDGDGLCSIVCGTKVASEGCPPSREVKQIQNALAKGGFFKGEGGGMSKDCAKNVEACDGIFDWRTKQAVEEFQKWKGGLTQDGVVGSNTLEALVNSKLLMNLKCNCEEEKIKEKPSDKDFISGDLNCDVICKCFQSVNTPGLKVGTEWSEFTECIFKNNKKKIKTDCPDYLDCMPKLPRTNPFCKDIKSFMKRCPTTKITY